MDIWIRTDRTNISHLLVPRERLVKERVSPLSDATLKARFVVALLNCHNSCITTLLVYVCVCVCVCVCYLLHLFYFCLFDICVFVSHPCTFLPLLPSHRCIECLCAPRLSFEKVMDDSHVIVCNDIGMCVNCMNFQVKRDCACLCWMRGMH